jgi:hypothetical protein
VSTLASTEPTKTILLRLPESDHIRIRMASSSSGKSMAQWTKDLLCMSARYVLQLRMIQQTEKPGKAMLEALIQHNEQHLAEIAHLLGSHQTPEDN